MRQHNRIGVSLNKRTLEAIKILQTELLETKLSLNRSQVIELVLDLGIGNVLVSLNGKDGDND